MVLRLTARKGKPAPVMIVKERLPAANPADGSERSSARLKDMGLIYGQACTVHVRPLQEMLAGCAMRMRFRSNCINC